MIKYESVHPDHPYFEVWLGGRSRGKFFLAERTAAAMHDAREKAITFRNEYLKAGPSRERAIRNLARRELEWG